MITKSHTNQTYDASLGQTDLEWLFFAAVRYQLDEFGGASLVITMSKEGLSLFEEDSDLESNEFSGISWPAPLAPEQQSDLLDLFERYENNPSLWWGEIEYQEGQFVEVWPGFTFEIPELSSVPVREALVTELGRGDFAGLGWLAPVVSEMLRPEPYFR